MKTLCVCVCVHTRLLDALSVRALVDKWSIGIDFNLENAALHFSPYETVGHLGGNPELLGQRKCITEGHKLQFRGYSVPSHKHTPAYTHSRETFLYLLWQTLWSVLRTHCSCCHCWNTAVTERLSVTTGDWRLATGKYVTASLGFTSHPYTRLSLSCMIQLKMVVVYKHRHTWQWPRVKWMKSNRLRFRLDRVHKPNPYLDLVIQETGWSFPCGWLLYRDCTKGVFIQRILLQSYSKADRHFLLNLMSAGE